MKVYATAEIGGRKFNVLPVQSHDETARWMVAVVHVHGAEVYVVLETHEAVIKCTCRRSHANQPCSHVLAVLRSGVVAPAVSAPAVKTAVAGFAGRVLSALLGPAPAGKQTPVPAPAALPAGKYQLNVPGGQP